MKVLPRVNKHEERKAFEDYKQSKKDVSWNFPFREAFERLKNRG